VLRAFNSARPAMTLSEVAERTDMNRAAARRFLLTLVREGYAESNGRYFRLRPKVLELGFSALASLDLSEVMQPIMAQLAEKLQESCFAAVLDDDSVIYIARAQSRRVINVGIDIGSRVPAHTVSSGRVLLSGLSEEAFHSYLGRVKLKKITPYTVTSKVKLRSDIEEVRRRGWSIVDQELEVGLRSISVPVRDRTGTIVAALNVCCPSPRIGPEEMHARILPALFDSAQRISRAILQR
jgi:IclR family transcriptional regulator, pca regulon regulatory protein